jgi:hypothetical protein
MGAKFDIERHKLLTKAIMKRVGVDQNMAGQLALRVLNYFGYEDEVIDNALDQDDRRLFYFLQDVQLLKTAWEEAILASGRTWRIFYWYLNIEKIEEHSKDVLEVIIEQGIYDTLPDKAWSRQEVGEEGN